MSIWHRGGDGYQAHIVRTLAQSERLVFTADCASSCSVMLIADTRWGAGPGALCALTLLWPWRGVGAGDAYGGTNSSITAALLGLRARIIVRARLIARWKTLSVDGVRCGTGAGSADGGGGRGGGAIRFGVVKAMS